MLAGFGLAVAYELGWIGVGPGAMWKTIAPWIGAGLSMGGIAAIRKFRLRDEMGLGDKD